MYVLFCMYWRSMGGSGWFTNMELYTNSSPVFTAVSIVFGSVRSNCATLTSKESNIRDKYSQLDLIIHLLENIIIIN